MVTGKRRHRLIERPWFSIRVPATFSKVGKPISAARGRFTPEMTSPFDQCFIEAFAPGGVWGGADEPLPSMGSGALPQKFFFTSVFSRGGAKMFAQGECLNETLFDSESRFFIGRPRKIFVHLLVKFTSYSIFLFWLDFPKGVQ
jgi:hypothetical protein